MVLKPVAKNQTELTFNYKHGQMVLFFSYQTPVAYVFDGNYAKKTGNIYSKTTTNHVNQFFKRYGFNPNEVDIIPQKEFDLLSNI